MHNHKQSSFIPNIQLDSDEEQRREIELFSQQQHLYNSNSENPALKNFLNAICDYAAKRNRIFKKIFISYAWPIEDVHKEKWTKQFIQGLAKHLSLLGFSVLLDETDSGPGMYLRVFMGKISDMDHVLVINTKTMQIKLGLDASGVLYEANEIKKALKIKTNTDFVINVLLKNGMYCDDAFLLHPYVSFFNTSYLDGLMELTSLLHGFDQKEFKTLWLNQIAEHKVTSRLWNLKKIIPQFISRIELLSQFKNLISNEDFKIICYGERGVGKTEFIKAYVYESYASYSSVYWLKAGNREDLLSQYLELAKNEKINTSSIDFNIELMALKTKEWLEKQFNRVLIIIDEAESINLIQDLVPRTGNILLITSNLDLKIAGYLNFEIRNFTFEEAENYIKSVIGEEKVKLAEGKFFEFINTLGNQPLRLARACGYIARQRKTIAEFLELYNELGELLFAQNILPSQTIKLYSENFDASLKEINSSVLNIKEDIAQYQVELSIKLTDIIRININSLPSAIENLLSLLFNNNLFATAEYFSYFFSHVEALLFYFKQFDNFNYFHEQGKFLLNKYPATNIIISPNVKKEESKPCIAVNQEDDLTKESKRCQEQQNLHNLKSEMGYAKFYLFLNDIWKFALGMNNDKVIYPSKKIYIFLPAADIAKIENWVISYIELLKNHLIAVGFKVFPEDVYDLSQNIPEDIDHVLVISHRNTGMQSGFIHQATLDKKISEHPNFGKGKLRFAIPVLLNNINYLSDIFKEIAELSFYKNLYLDALSSLIGTVYEFNYDAFKIYWRERLVYNKIISNTWNVPTKKPNFVGREALLDYLNTQLTVKNSQELILLAACSGMGGVGKTQLVLQYIELYCHKYNQIYWINAESEEMLSRDFIKLGEQKRLFFAEEQLATMEKVRIVKTWLQNNEAQGWLLIFDNADSYTNQTLKEALPLKGGAILITSRHTQWENYKEIDVFSAAEAQQYIKLILSENIAQPQQEDVIKLIEILQRLPLALAHACAYIKHNNITIKEFLTLDPILALSEKIELTNQTYDPVTLTWNITFARMIQEYPHAVNLLYCCSYYYHASMPFYLIKNIFQPQQSQALLEDTFSHALRVASEYSMIHIDEMQQQVSIHKLVHETILKQINSPPFTYYNKSMLVLQGTFIRQPTEETKNAIYRDLKMHFERCIEIYKDALKNYLENFHNYIHEHTIEYLLIYLINTYKASGEFHNRVKVAEQVLYLRKELYGNFSKEVAASLNDLAIAYGRIGKTIEEKNLLINSLLMKQKLIDNGGNVSTYATLTNLGSVFCNLGEYSTAESYLLQALNELNYSLKSSNQIDFFPKKDQKPILDALSSLAVVYGELGLMLKKKELLERILGIQKSIYKNNSSEISLTLMNLAIVIGQLGDQQKKYDLLEEVLTIEKFNYGEEHPHYSKALMNYANACGKLGQVQRKQQYLEKVLAIEEAYYGKEGLTIAQVLSNLSDAYLELGFPLKAKKLLKRAKLIMESYDISNSSSLATIHINFGKTYCDLGKIEKGRKFLIMALQFGEEHYNKSHPYMASVLTCVASTYSQNEDIIGQITRKILLERSLMIKEKHYGINHREYALTLIPLAVTYFRLEELETHRALLEEKALKIYLYHENHPDVAVIYSNLSNYYAAVGNRSKQKEFLELALIIYKKNYYENHPDIQKVQEALNALNTAESVILNENTQASMIPFSLFSNKYRSKDTSNNNWGLMKSKEEAKIIFSFFNSSTLKTVGCVSCGCYEVQQQIKYRC